jgi:hypothetical protein
MSQILAGEIAAAYVNSETPFRTVRRTDQDKRSSRRVTSASRNVHCRAQVSCIKSDPTQLGTNPEDRLLKDRPSERILTALISPRDKFD